MFSRVRLMTLASAEFLIVNHIFHWLPFRAQHGIDGDQVSSVKNRQLFGSGCEESLKAFAVTEF